MTNNLDYAASIILDNFTSDLKVRDLVQHAVESHNDQTAMAAALTYISTAIVEYAERHSAPLTPEEREELNG